jgi:myo-inositol 2-dehydrogenase / D-chiro-inositol 1-dehydrogenase
MNKIRYGIIGCGSMGREHIENIRAMGGAVVTAVSDPTRPCSMARSCCSRATRIC